MFFIKDIFLKGKYSEIIKTKLETFRRIRKNLAVVPINEEIIDICEKIIEKYKLLPNDAFAKVDFLEIVKV